MELVHQPAPPPPAITRGAVGVGAMLQAAIDKGVTAENVEAVKSLVQLYEHMEERDAKKAYAEAFNALQAEMPRIKAVRPVPDKHGAVKYCFAPYEDIMEQVRPLLLKHGFTVTFSTRYESNRLVKICTLTHKQGHSSSNEFGARIGGGPPGASETQADGAAGTYAKRFALCDALNIVVEKDSDANLEGENIGEKKGKELEDRLRNVEGNSADFLRLAGAPSFAEISSVKLDMLEELLAKKERVYMAKLEGKK